MQARTAAPAAPVGSPEKAGAAAVGTEKAVAGIESLAGSAHEAVDRVADSMVAAARQLGGQGRELLASQHRWTEASRDTVRRHPIASVAIALAAGVLLSRLSRH